ncbi:MAG TPA: hypothetical protein VF125_02410 [Solirubrobacterales bacterium]
MRATQAVVVYLPSQLVRALKPLVGEGKPYADISELAELSLQNQLALETERHSQIPGDENGPKGDRGRLPSLSALPDFSPPALALPDDEALTGALSPFTNRLFPVKLACRVLANCTDGVSLRDFQMDAAETAREVGRALRNEDAEAGRKGMERRWVALPVGEKGASTLNRFINHFTITQRRGGFSDGPLARLGLAAWDAEGRPRLTELGWKLACEPNPVFDGAGDGVAETLGPGDRALFEQAIASNRAESRNLAEFRVIVNATNGQQGAIDERLRKGRGLNHDEGAVYRAGIIGRLHDLAKVTVVGTGEGARVVLSDSWPWTGSA